MMKKLITPPLCCN